MRQTRILQEKTCQPTCAFDTMSSWSQVWTRQCAQLYTLRQCARKEDQIRLSAIFLIHSLRAFMSDRTFAQEE